MASDTSVFAELETVTAKWDHLKPSMAEYQRETERLNREIDRVERGEGPTFAKTVEHRAAEAQASPEERQRRSEPPLITARPASSGSTGWFGRSSPGTEGPGVLTLDEKLGIGVAAALALAAVVFVILYFTVIRNDISPAANTVAARTGTLTVSTSADRQDGWAEVGLEVVYTPAAHDTLVPGEWRVSRDGGRTFPVVVATTAPDRLVYAVPGDARARRLCFRLVDAHDSTRHVTSAVY